MPKKHLFISALLLASVFCCTLPLTIYAQDNTALITRLKTQIAQLQFQLQTLLKQQASYSFTKNLGYANSGSQDVAELHKALAKENISYAPDTGNIYSQATMQAVKQYQQKHNITPVSGYVGPKTRTELNKTSATVGGSPPSDLLLDWKFDEALDSGNIVIDSSGNNHNGTIVGNVARVLGRDNGALQFYGSAGHVDTNFTVGPSVTVSVWAKVPPNINSMLWMFGNSGQEANLHFYGNAIYLDPWQPVNLVYNYEYNTSFIVDQWHLYTTVISQTDNNAKLYIDGDFVGAANYRESSSAAFHVSGLTAGFWNGLVDEVRVYNRALSAQEVADDANIQIFSLTASAGANGSISPLGTVNVKQGYSKTFTVTPSADYLIDQVLVDGAVATLASGNTYTFANVQANHTISATFMPNSTPLSLNISVSGQGTVTRNPDQPTYTYGSTVTLTANPSSGYLFSGWYGDIVSDEDKQKIATVVVKKNINATVRFNPVESISPRLPTSQLDTSYVLPTGRTWHVNNGDNFQTILNSANLGDVIILQAGATFTGPFVLPNKSGSGWIYIISSDLASLPEHKRITPADSVHMPRITAPSYSSNYALRAELGAHNYRLVGIEITTAYDKRDDVQYGIVRLGYDNNGDGAQTLAGFADNIILDRAYVHGTSTGNNRDGIVTVIKRFGVIDSYVSNFHGVQYEAHALHIFKGTGPIKIENNYLESAGVNFFIGDNYVQPYEEQPQDITIKGNYFYKPLSWKSGSSDYAGIPWTAKNLFEIKAGRRILVEGNIFENSWIAADQGGFCSVITPRAGPVEDITIQKNILRGCISAFQLNPANVSINRMLIQNNLIYNTGGMFTAMAGYQNVYADLTYNHNTQVNTDTSRISGIWLGDVQTALQKMTFTNNLFSPYSGYGYGGTNKGTGWVPIEYYTTANRNFSTNVLIGAKDGNDNIIDTPTGVPDRWEPQDKYGDHFGFVHNFLPGYLSEIGFINVALTQPADFALLSSSIYHNAGLDGKDIGADIPAVLAATAHAIDGNPKPSIPVLAVNPGSDLVSLGGPGGPFAPNSIVYTLQNTGNQQLNWQANKTTTWLTLSKIGGVLGQNQTDTVTATINSNANSLAQGTYTDTISFNNTTNGQGNTTRSVSLTAIDQITTYTLTTTASPLYDAGTILRSPSQASYQEGSSVTLTANPSKGYKFNYWQGSATGNTNPIALTMDSNKTVSASFVPETVTTGYTITATENSTACGNISPQGQVKVQPGAMQTFSASRGPDCLLSDVIVDGISQAPVPDYLFTYTFKNVQADHTIQAVFVPVEQVPETPPGTYNTDRQAQIASISAALNAIIQQLKILLGQK